MRMVRSTRLVRPLLVAALLLVSCSDAEPSTTSPAPAAASSEAVAQTGVVECADLWHSGDAVVEPTASAGAFSKIVQALKPLLGVPPEGSIIELGSGESVYGRVHVVLPFRDQAVLDQIREIDEQFADGEGVCVELPPQDYYDRPLESAPWEVTDPVLLNDPAQPRVRVAIGGMCGGGLTDRLRSPVVVETESTVTVDIPLEHSIWGMMETLECQSPGTMTIVLNEPLGDRTLLGCGRDACVEAPTPVGTPAPVPPVMPNVQTALALEALLLAAGFEQVGLDHPIDPVAVAIGTWDAEIYTIGLYQGDFRPDLDNVELIDCPIGTLSLQATLPVDARTAVLSAADC